MHTSLRKYGLISLLLLFILLDFLFSLLLIRTTGKYRREKQLNLEQQYMFENISRTYSDVISLDVKDFIESAGLGDFNNNGVLFIVPPSPCDGCLRSQCDILENFLESNPEIRCSTRIICPSHFSRDMRAKFGIMPVTYEAEEMFDSDLLLSKFDGCILIDARDGEMTDFYLSNKLFPDLTMNFLGRLSENREL